MPAAGKRQQQTCHPVQRPIYPSLYIHMVDQASIGSAVRDGHPRIASFRRRSISSTALLSNHDYERLKQQLWTDLLTREEWVSSIKDGVQQFEGSVGVELTYDELLSRITPMAKSVIPDETKAKMLGQIQAVLDKK